MGHAGSVSGVKLPGRSTDGAGMSDPTSINPLLLAIGGMVLLGMLHVLAVALRNAKDAHSVHHEAARLKIRYYAMGVAIDRDDDPERVPQDTDSILLYLFGDQDPDQTSPVGRIEPAEDAIKQAA